MSIKFGCIYDISTIYGILSLLNDSGEAKIADMMSKGREGQPCFKTLDSRLGYLMSEGLVTYRENQVGRKARLYRLTEKGKAFIRLLELGLMVNDGRVDAEQLNFRLDMLEMEVIPGRRGSRSRAENP